MTNYYALFLLLLFLYLPYPNFAQRTNAQKQQAFIDAFRDGDQLLANNKYRKAQKAYEKAIAIKPTMAATYRRLGVVHEILGEYKIAADYFEKCLEVNPELSRALYFQAGEMHLKNENYLQATKRLKEYQNFQKLPPESFENGELELSTEAHYNMLLESYLANCQFAAHKVSFADVQIKNLGEEINSELDESFPYISNDENWMFYTRNVPLQAEDKLMHSISKDALWTKGQTVLNKKITKNFNQGMGKISRDEKVMFFPGCNREDILGGCDILKAAMQKENVSNIDKLSDKVNSEHWDSQPSINCEGKSLYFVSNRPGGYGGTDIWVSHLQENGWTEAVNLGPKINTAGDEESPFISDDNVTLYFASNGHPGFGDMDIFYARNSEEGDWGEPQNLGKPVNSGAREISFFINARGNKAYLASERKGGFGGLDIYEFNMPARKDFEEIAYVKGRVLDAETKKPIESVVYIAEKGNYQTDAEGRFFICHPTLSKLKVLVSERKYHDFQYEFELTNWNQEGFAEIDIYLRPLNQPMKVAQLSADLQPKAASLKSEKIEIKAPNKTKAKAPETEKIYTTSDVYFYFDNFSLTKEARYNLDKLIEDIELDQLSLIIIEGFADQIGTDDYNQKLSEKRAKEVAYYFKSKGLTKLRIKYKGYGETKNSLIYSENRKVEIYVYYKI